MMGQMIIPEFQIFGEFLPLKQLSGTTAGISGAGQNYWGAMAPHNAVDPSVLNFALFFFLAKNLLNVFKNNPIKYFCTICYIFLAHHALLSGKVEGLNFNVIL